MSFENRVKQLSLGLIVLALAVGGWQKLIAPKLAGVEAADAEEVQDAPTQAALPIAAQLTAHGANPLAALPVDAWRTFAKPLPLGREEMLLFQREVYTEKNHGAVLWRINWKDGIAARGQFQLPLEEKQRYSVIATTRGLWFVGPSVALVPPQGETLYLPGFDHNEPVLAPLPDGSVLVLGDIGGKDGQHLQRLSHESDGPIQAVDLGVLSHASKPNESQQFYREPSYGQSAVTLADGRVLMLGGGRTPQLASLIDPATGKIEPAAQMPHSRSNAAAALLPDGRVLAAGGEHLRCYEPDARTADIYAPKENRWISLPDMPFPFCADAYGADRPSIALAPDGALVLAGNLETEIMMLAPDEKSATGYSAQWRVIPGPVIQRISGIAQVRMNGEVVIAGGVHNPGDFGDCCKATPGVDRIAPQPSSAPWRSIGLGLNGPGVARRGAKVLIAAGRRFSWTGSGQLRYSGVAELLDLNSGEVRQLPPLPFATGGADAAWLDDDRVLVKGRAASNDRGFENSLSSYVARSSNGMAIYSLAAREWKLLDLPALATHRLVAQNDKALLFANDAGEVSALRISDLSVENLPHALRGRQGATYRWLADGRLLRAGGQAQTEMVSVEKSCDDESGKCSEPEEFMGFGPLAPARDYEMLNATTHAWSFSGPSQAQGVSAVIDAQGRVTQLGWVGNENNGDGRLLIERSGLDARTAWQALTSPPPWGASNEAGCTSFDRMNCQLLLVPDPRDAANELLFLRQGDLAQDVGNLSRVKTRILWFNPATNEWTPVLEISGAAARDQPQDLPEPLSTPDRKLRSLGWHLPQPILW